MATTMTDEQVYAEAKKELRQRKTFMATWVLGR